MRRNRHIGVWGAAAVMLAVSAGCSATGESAGPAPVDDRVKPATPAKPEKMLLRTALVPGMTPQSVRIQLHERRETSGDDVGTVVHELELDLTGTLTRERERPNRESEARLVLNQIKLRLGVAGQAEQTLSYDSAKDEPGQGNPLADVMAVFKDAEVELVVGPSGRLRELSGLTQRWGKTGMIMAPPALLTAQWLFRDESMQELVAEALFPPMPAGPVAVGDAWEVVMPANVPLVARLNARVRSTLKEVDGRADETRAGRVKLEGSGTLEPAPPILPGDRPAIQPAVKNGTMTIVQYVNAGSPSLVQASRRNLEMLLTLTPPTGDERVQMTIKQTRRLVSRREGR